MKIGITGISSTLGAVILDEILPLPQVEEIIGLDLRFQEFLNHPKITFHKGDVRNREKVAECFRGVDVLIHMAFIVVHNVPDDDKIYDINVNGTKTVFLTAAALGIPKIIYTSSVAAYGILPDLPIPIKESTPLRGCENRDFYYAYTKGIVAEYLNEFETAHPEIIVTRFRPHVIIGPKFISMTDNTKRIMRQFLHKEKPYIGFATRRQMKNGAKKYIQYTDERDLAKAMTYTLLNAFPGVYNITGEPMQLNTFLEKRGQKHVTIPLCLVLLILSIGSIFSKKLAILKKWAKISQYPVIASSEKLIASAYPYPLTPTEALVIESIEQLKIIEAEASK